MSTDNSVHQLPFLSLNFQVLLYPFLRHWPFVHESPLFWYLLLLPANLFGLLHGVWKLAARRLWHGQGQNPAQEGQRAKDQGGEANPICHLKVIYEKMVIL